MIEDSSTPPELLRQEIAQPMATKTATKTKTTYYKNADDETLWYVRVKGTFTYKEKKKITHDEFERIIAMYQSDKKLSHWALPIQILYMTGLRAGEVFGLN